ncbi:origin recognition complex subunit 5-like protein [Sporodiniella umbellata]|nr:origin recognition complex subunit 5-like protein [Sporodiniella umbellata]
MCQLCDKFPGRSEQIHYISALFSSAFRPQSIFVYGPPSTGKTSVLKRILNDYHSVSSIHCVESFTPRLLFQRALDGFCRHKPDHKNNYTSFKRIDTLQQFVRTIVQTNIGTEKPAFLLLDRAERLRELPNNVLSGLLRLSELTSRNICVIMVSNISFEKFRVKGGSIEPLMIRFPDYSEQDILQILQFDFTPSEIETEYEPVILTQSFYAGFVQVIYSIFCHNCKDLNELRYFAALLFPLYIKPIQEGLAQIHETPKLIKLAQPYFAEATEKLYLREMSSIEWTEQQKVVGRTDFDLPYYSKFLLISSYLASYNPPRFDVRYFAKSAEERRKKKGGGTRKRVDNLGGKMRQQLLGPKAFPVERMLAIFYSILDEPLEDTIDIQLQITSLTTLRLLVRTTSLDKLDGSKYKCNVNFEFIRAIAQSVRFEVDKYLYDFL